MSFMDIEEHSKNSFRNIGIVIGFTLFVILIATGGFSGIVNRNAMKEPNSPARDARTPSIESALVFEKGTDFKVYKFYDANNIHYVAISYNGSVALGR